METKKIKELMQAMGRYSISRLNLKHEGVELELEAVGPQQDPSFTTTVEPPALHPSTQTRPISPFSARMRTSDKEDQNSEEESVEEFHYVTSPMVGTFYSQPSPEIPPYIKPGDQVESETIVCIIEAMKVMNEIKAGDAGEVVKVLVQSGQPVEFGTRLFALRKGN